MGAPRRMMAAAAGLALVATTVTAVAAQDNRPNPPPNDVVAAAWAAADDARTAAKALAAAAEDDDTGERRGRGTDAFKERHAALALRHEGRPGKASQVHAALAGDASPASLGREKAATARGLGKARQALDGDERPGRGLGRDKAPGPPDHAGGDDDLDGATTDLGDDDLDDDDDLDEDPDDDLDDDDPDDQD